VASVSAAVLSQTQGRLNSRLCCAVVAASTAIALCRSVEKNPIKKFGKREAAKSSLELVDATVPVFQYVSFDAEHHGNTSILSILPVYAAAVIAMVLPAASITETAIAFASSTKHLRHEDEAYKCITSSPGEDEQQMPKVLRIVTCGCLPLYNLFDQCGCKSRKIQGSTASHILHTHGTALLPHRPAGLT